MAGHVSDAELMDLLEGRTGGSTGAHVEACAHCRSRLDAASHGLLLARDADVPEPSPLYWEAFRRQVDRRIGDEGPAFWWRFRLAPALAAVAALVAAVSFLPQRPAVPAAGAVAVALPAWSALPPADEDTGLSVLQALTPSPEDLASARACRGVEDCLAGLSDDESNALAEALRTELKGSAL